MGWKEETVEKGAEQAEHLLALIRAKKGEIARLEAEYKSIVKAIELLGGKERLSIQTKVAEKMLVQSKGIVYSKSGKATHLTEESITKILMIADTFRLSDVCAIVRFECRSDNAQAHQNRASGYLGYLMENGKVERVKHGVYRVKTEQKPDPPQKLVSDETTKLYTVDGVVTTEKPERHYGD